MVRRSDWGRERDCHSEVLEAVGIAEWRVFRRLELGSHTATVGEVGRRMLLRKVEVEFERLVLVVALGC